jgi:hypothetical protein
MSILDVNIQQIDQNLIDRQEQDIQNFLRHICPAVPYKVLHKEDNIYHRGSYYSYKILKRRYKGVYYTGIGIYSLIDIELVDDCFRIKPLDPAWPILFVVMDDDVFDEFNDENHLPSFLKFDKNTKIQFLYGDRCQKRFVGDERFILEKTYEKEDLM